MAERQMNANIPRQSVIYLAVCLTGLAIFILAGILPNIWTMEELGKQTTEAQFRLEEKRTLNPIQKSLQDRNLKKESDLLPLPEKGKLGRSEINTLPLTFGTFAKMSGMSMTSSPMTAACAGSSRWRPRSAR